MTGAVDGVARDLAALQAAGVDGLLFCNEADLPYQLEVGHEISAAMASIVGQLRSEVRVPFGVNVLWDPIASLAVARATGARFVREVLTGVYESDLGMIEPHIGNIAGYRSAIGGDDIALFDNIAPEFASAIGSRGVAERAKARPSCAWTPSSSPARPPGAVRDERSANREGSRTGSCDHRQYRRSGGWHRGDLRGRRWRHRGDEPQGGRPYMEPGRPGPGESADGGSALGALIALTAGRKVLVCRSHSVHFPADADRHTFAMTQFELQLAALRQRRQSTGFVAWFRGLRPFDRRSIREPDERDDYWINVQRRLAESDTASMRRFER